MKHLKLRLFAAALGLLSIGAATAQAPHEDYANTPNGKLVLEWFSLWAQQGKDKEAFSGKYVVPSYVHHVRGTQEPLKKRLEEVEAGRKQIPTWREDPLSIFVGGDLVFLTSLRNYGVPNMAPTITSRLVRVKDGKIVEDYMLGHTDPKQVIAALKALER